MHRTMAVVLLGMSLLIQSHVVTADATPYPAQILGWCSYNQLNNIRYGCGFTSPAQACSAAASATSLVFDHFDMTDGYAAGRCWYSDSGLPSLPLDTYHRVWTRNTYCYRGGQEEDYTVAAPICSCRGFPPGYVYPPGGPGPGLPLCVPGTCPVEPLTPIDQLQPNGPDVLPLTQLLERTRGADLALTQETETARQCLIGKASGAGVTVRTTSGTRTIAYQNHFIEIWNKMMEHNNYEDDPVVWEACRSRREEIIAEKGCSSSQGCVGACTPGSHCIRAEPATDSRHPDGRAFDVSENTINSLRANLAALQPPQSISQLLTSPPACNLNWGGSFNNPDNVHFQLP